jgi:hypothetical protein
MVESAETVIKVKVLPRSSRTEIAGKQDDVYRVKITDSPVEGKANKALIGLLAEKLGIPKGEIEIVSGKTARLKTIRIRGLIAAEIAQALVAESREHRA